MPDPRNYRDQIEAFSVIDEKFDNAVIISMASTAISLRRIADALERMASKPLITQEGNEGR